jgi:tetratricopeptide (TPR) repeat protein
MGKFLTRIILLNLILHAIPLSFAQNEKMDSLKSVLYTQSNDTNKVITLNAISWDYFVVSELDSCYLYATEAMELSEKLDYQKGIARAHTRFGAIYFNKGNFYEALISFSKCMKISKKTKDNKALRQAYNNMGAVYFLFGNYPEALKNHYKSLQMSEESGDYHGIASACSNIGDVYTKQGNYKEALKNFKVALEIRKKMDDQGGMSDAYNGIGMVCDDLGQYAVALNSHKHALQIRKTVNDKRGEANSYNNIGLVYEHLRDYDKAINNHLLAMGIQMGMGDQAGSANSHISIGNAFVKKNKIAKGLEFLKTGLEIGLGIGNKESIKNAYLGISNALTASGDHLKAFDNYKMFVIYRDSLSNEEKLQESLRSKLTYEFEKEQILDAQHEKEQLKLEQEKIARRNNLQYTFIFLIVAGIIGAILLLGYIKLPQTMAQWINFVALLLVFESILVFADPYLDIVTRGIPIYKLLINIILAALIFPLHRFLEKKFKRTLKVAER